MFFFLLKNYLCHHGVTGEFRHSSAQLGELSHVIQRTQCVQLLQSCKSNSWVKICIVDPDPHPAPLVTSTIPAPDPSIIKQN